MIISSKLVAIRFVATSVFFLCNVIVASESLGPSSRRTALVISEIMYHPEAKPDGIESEFIELHNSQPWEENISGFRLSGAVDYEFPADTLIPAGGLLVVAKAPVAVEAVFGIENVLGPYEGQLSNEGETLRLRNPGGALLLEVSYMDGSPWPLAADGLGHSLVLARPSHGESNPMAWAASSSIDGSPGAAEEPDPDPRSQLVINEVGGHPTQVGSGFVEIFNRGKTTIEIGGARLSVNRDTAFVIQPDTSLAPGERLVVEAQAPDLLLDGGQILLGLTNPDGTRVIDAIRYLPNDVGTSFGRVPDGSENWHVLANATSGSENGPAIKPTIVFNEIMFHPISGLAEDEYLEFFNRTPDPVNLAGWQVAGGINFTFPEGASIPSSGYFVIAKDVARLRQSHPHLNVANSIGNYEGKLSDSGKSLQLLRPAGWQVPVDPAETPLLLVDEVSYQDESRLSRWADGGGSSLELVDPHSNNDLAANWADSDESQKSEWTDVEVTEDITRIFGLTPRSFQIMLLGAGEMLVDDVELFRPGSSNRVRNGDFESTANWVFQGNHEGSIYVDAPGEGNDSRALLVRSPGRGDTHSNRIRQTILSGLATPGQASVRAKIRWLRGHPEILLRLHGNYMEAVGTAQLPTDLGSPGLRNSRWQENAPPVIREVSHSPVLPDASESVTVTATVSDPDGVGEVTLNYRVDISGGATGAIEMVDDGIAPDKWANDGIFSGTIPGQSTGRMVAFSVEAMDSHQLSPTARTFPEEVPEQECLVRFGDGAATNGFGDYRLWFTRDTHRKWIAGSRAKASNLPLDVTFISNGERAIYNVGATYSGSFFNSPDYDGPTGRPCDYSCRFSGDELFLGASKIILSWPGLTGTPDNTAQHEQFAYWLASQLGLPFNHRRYVTVIVNGVRRGTVMEDTQRPSSDMLRQWFPGDSDGELFKTQIRYEGNDASTDLVLAATEAATLQPFTDTGGSHRTASYRWNWAPQAIGNSVNRFDSIFQLVETLDTQDGAAYTQSVRSLLDIEQWMRTFAFEHTVGNWDSYGYGNGQNMYAYKPVDGQWQLMMWDLDIGSGSGLGDGATRSLFALTNTLFPIVNGDPKIVGRMYQNPEFVRAYWRTLEEAANGPMIAARVDAYLDPKFDALRASFGGSIQPPTAIKSYMGQRRNYILQQLASQAAAQFEILTPATFDFETDSSPLVVRGSAAVSVQTIRVNGLPVTPVWTDVNEWEIQIPLFQAESEILIEGFDRFENLAGLSSASLSVTFTGDIDPVGGNIVLNEWMASNQSEISDPADGRFEDWLELFNAGDSAINLAGYTLTDDLNIPGRWTFPADSVIEPGGYFFVWLDGDIEQQEVGNGQFHASFSLSSSGESIGLFSADGVRVDAVEFGAQETDVSMGRLPNGTRNPPIPLPTTSPSAPNILPFRILEVSSPAPGMLLLTWESIPGEVYLVQQSPSLRKDSWTDVSDLVSAVATSTSAEILVSPNQFETLFFRVKNLIAE